MIVYPHSQHWFSVWQSCNCVPAAVPHALYPSSVLSSLQCPSAWNTPLALFLQGNWVFSAGGS